jgi:hydroxyacylglutathione hydrolase
LSSSVPAVDTVALQAAVPVVRTILNRDFRSNTYALRLGSSAAAPMACVLIDPGLNREAIEADLAECGWQPQAVLCTHGHFDHVGSAAWAQSVYQVPVYLCEADLRLAKMANFLLTACKLPQRISLPEFTLLPPNATVVVGEKAFTFHALPGHTPGSAGITVDNLLFSGDSLYARRTALSQLPGEDHAQLRQSLQHLFTWIAGDVIVYPGHGSSTTIADVQQHNEELRAFMAEA